MRLPRLSLLFGDTRGERPAGSVRANHHALATPAGATRSQRMALEAGTRFVAKTEEGGAAYDALREHAAREDHRQRQLGQLVSLRCSAGHAAGPGENRVRRRRSEQQERAPNIMESECLLLRPAKSRDPSAGCHAVASRRLDREGRSASGSFPASSALSGVCAAQGCFRCCWVYYLSGPCDGGVSASVRSAGC